jgi:hypothetical protein
MKENNNLTLLTISKLINIILMQIKIQSEK